ncbi:MAG: hypothetical protein P9M14_11735 [Candidatus Alcyoniella australis]|nr:hypothetical protein [Candidatus Alcyoniella australis]
MRRFKLPTFACLLAAAMLLAVSSTAQEPVSGFETFTSEQFGIEFTYPTIWEKMPTLKAEDLFIAQSPGKMTGVFVYVNNDKQHSAESLDTLASTLPEQITNQPGGKLVEAERPGICGSKAVSIKYEIVNEAGKLHGQVLIVLNRGSLINFNFFTNDLVARYDKAVIANVISTIHCND